MTRRAGHYYECSLRRMDTSATFEERGKVRAQDGSPLPLDEYQLDDPETGKRWELDGLFVCDIDAADLRAMLNDWGGGDDAVMVSVEDNGYHGDGLWLLVSPNTRAGTPETHKDKWGDLEGSRVPRKILGLRLTPRQARILGTALCAAANLRDAQGETPTSEGGTEP